MTRRILKVVYVQPSRYDDEGYIVRYWRGVLPSNTMLCLKALTESIAESGELGVDVEVLVEGFHDAVERVPVARLARQNRRRDTQVVVGLVGVQSNQFARAADLALELRALGLPVIIGGFHVSGVLALQDAPSPELQNLLDHGVSLVKGEVEAPGVLAGILKDVLENHLQDIYDIREAPCLDHAPVPFPSKRDLRRFFSGGHITVDTSRGCPFDCSFCTIINVQGRKMRSRSAPSFLETIASHYRKGITSYFFTDDNFSRSPIWEELLDGIIALREQGMDIRFMMQVDTLAYRLPHFVEKAARAGCYQVFVGVESMNAKNLVAAGKRQNRVEDYVDMVDAWHGSNVLVYAGYIIGFPHDTPDSVHRDIAVLANAVKVDLAAFFMLTPLPGSRDHKHLLDAFVPLDADLNNYDSCHETFAHPNFAPGAWVKTYREAWEHFYTRENIVNTLLRTPRKQYWRSFWTLVYFRYCVLTQTHPMMTGLFPIKGFRRRPAYPREGLGRCLARRIRDFFIGAGCYLKLLYEFEEVWLLTQTTPVPQRNFLAAVRWHWVAAQLRVSQERLEGRCSQAAEALCALFSNTAEQLRCLDAASGKIGVRTKSWLLEKARDVDNYLACFSATTCSWEEIRRAEHFIQESVIGEFECVALWSLGKHLFYTKFFFELVTRARSGKVHIRDLIIALQGIFFEGFLGIRVAFAMFARGFHRSRV